MTHKLIQQFRDAVYQSLQKRPDAILDLIDALTVAGHVESPVALSEEPLFRRKFSLAPSLSARKTERTYPWAGATSRFAIFAGVGNTGRIAQGRWKRKRSLKRLPSTAEKAISRDQKGQNSANTLYSRPLILILVDCIDL